MGAWGTTLYSNDTTSAIRDEYIKKLNSGEPNEEITMDLIKEFQALIVIPKNRRYSGMP